MLLRTARRKGGAIFVWHTLAPAISREEHSSYCSAQSGDAPLLREISIDVDQKSGDSQATERSTEIHSGEVQGARVSSAQTVRKVQLFCGILAIKFICSNYID